MTARSSQLVVALVRAWTRMYTVGSDPVCREERRAEIESDVWELLHDPDGGRGLTPAGQVLGRLIAGVPDDLLWRLEQVGVDPRMLARTIPLAAAAIAAIALWTLPDRQPREGLS